MTQKVDLRVDRIDPTYGQFGLLPFRPDEVVAYRAAYGDAVAIFTVGGGRLRIQYLRAEGDTRMKHLIDALCDFVDSRRLRFVLPRESDDAVETAHRHVFGDMGPALDEVLTGYDRVVEDWHEDGVPCFDVEWGDR